jgi:hypothetical protein
VGGIGAAGGGTGATPTGVGITAGAANTGSGGGGNSWNAGGNGAAGGSGIVILRYPSSQSAPVATTGSPQVSIANGYQVYTWTSSGSITF